jgi:hypothetical protein
LLERLHDAEKLVAGEFGRRFKASEVLLEICEAGEERLYS